MIYKAGRLDARNIGSSVGVYMGDAEYIFGTVAAIHRNTDNVLVYLTDNEDPLALDHGVDVDVHLSSAGLHTLHTKNEVERLRQEFGQLGDAIMALLNSPAPRNLKAV